ncbi:MAG: prepilin-type N-terminal cleavage/methylation domain-containing protein [Patescibacteria group bacterium]|nr:prepilin-type N-terminal cleavage/methylation domain-containing protein [Patescibacteria group bacterium]
MRLKNKGFTLIELLVVISLIGILAIAVLSAINPIEQLNKGRDAGRRADSAQIAKAIDRYYASNEKFPWNNSSAFTDYISSADAAFKSTGEKAGVGICGGTTIAAINQDEDGCTLDGVLISGFELKSQFGKRKAFRTGPIKEDVFYIVKELDDPSVSVCFVPSSNAKRTDWDTLKDVDLTAETGSISQCGGGITEPTWEDAANSCMVCIPEE